MISYVKKNYLTSITKYLSKKIASSVDALSEKEKDQIFEIRLKVNKPLVIRSSNGIKFISNSFELINQYTKSNIIVTENDLNESFEKICEYSVYSHQDEIKNGFITIKGGHRIGICGTAVMKDGVITSIKNISSLNIRISREIIGAADKILSKVSCNDKGFLIVGPPSSGKTTILRDIARQMSSIYQKCVVIVDERCELAATYNGVSYNNVGLCDVLSGYPKGEGILQAIRTLSPEIIICDEIGGKNEAFAVKQGLNAGVSIISSIHASSLDSLLLRPQARELLDTGAFKKLVLLEDSSRPAQIKEIIKVDDLYVKNTWSNNRNYMRYSTRRNLIE